LRWRAVAADHFRHIRDAQSHPQKVSKAPDDQGGAPAVARERNANAPPARTDGALPFRPCAYLEFAWI
jgi:hypothetical protein